MAFDLDALAREADREPFEFVFGGEDYTIDADPDYRAFVAMQENRVNEGVRLLLGEEQYARLESSPEMMRLSQLVALMNAYLEHIGVTLGELAASSTSSNRTARRSRPTSRPRTSSRSPIS